MAEKEPKNVVVIGGGIAGALLAKHLQNHAHITLIDPYVFPVSILIFLFILFIVGTHRCKNAMYC